MNTAALMTLVATILGVQGPLLLIALGNDDGLRRGDLGSIYYEVATEGDLETVSVGSARIVATTDGRSVLLVDPEAAPISGQLVEFEIPADRLESGAEQELLTTIAMALVDTEVDPCLPVQPLPGLFGEPLTCLTPGSAVEILARLEDWTLGRNDDVEGWMAADSLNVTEERPGATSEVREAPAHAGSLPSRDEALEDRLREIDAKLEKSRDARQRLTDRLEQSSGPEGAVAATGDELGQVTESVRDLREQLRLAEAELADAERAHEELSQLVLARTVGELQKRLEDAEASLREAEIERRTLAGTVEDLSEENESLRLRLATAETLRDEALADADRMRDRIEILEPVSPAERQAIETELERRDAEISRLEDVLARMRVRIQDLEAAADSPEDPPDVEEESPSRRPRWKFWKRNRTSPGNDSATEEDRSNGSGGGDGR
jgi:predicted  nucleic acid-binding Zn-ribbon protein